MPQITESIGRVLGKRYRLVSALGTGASAHVFLAEDVSLQRLVAVKVLQPELAQNEAFLKRFRAEARSVASLNHPNVLRVFDWGEDADGPYLVLEYLGGGSLRDLLDRGVALSLAQVARIGSQAAQGLAYAHSRGLVHRDIKPANLLFDDEGRVRVADFGVARALAEEAWTEPEGAMVGTARYAAPEQAQGQAVDGRADVYALALVLYEAVTGSVPFVRDTTLGTLMARVGAPLPHDEALGPLDNVLARAAAPEASARLDAAGLAARLDALSAALPSPAPLQLQPTVTEPPLSGGFRPPTTRDLTQMVPVAGAATAVTATDLSATAVGERTEAVPRHAAAGDALAAPPSLKVRKRRRRWPWLVAALVLLAAVGGGLAAAARAKVFTPSHPVPVLKGLTLPAARADLARYHFTLATGAPVFSTSVPTGLVITQQPSPSTVEKEGAVVHVVASKGLPDVSVPSLTGLDCAAAIRVLAVADLTGVCPNAASAYSTTVPAGQVINWSWNNQLNATQAQYHGTVIMAISNGPPPVAVPDVAGQSYSAAQSALQGAGFAVVETQTTSQTVAQGEVISTSPGAGAMVQKGTTVTVTVSDGPPMVVVPDLGGDTVAQATTALTNQGLKVGSVYGPTGGTVFSSTPASGQTVTIGSTVNLYVQ